jgi:hypothetical protein
MALIRIECYTKSAPLRCSYKEWDFFIVFFVIQQFLSSCTSVYFPQIVCLPMPLLKLH